MSDLCEKVLNRDSCGLGRRKVGEISALYLNFVQSFNDCLRPKKLVKQQNASLSLNSQEKTEASRLAKHAVSDSLPHVIAQDLDCHGRPKSIKFYREIWSDFDIDSADAVKDSIAAKASIAAKVSIAVKDSIAAEVSRLARYIKRSTGQVQSTFHASISDNFNGFLTVLF